MIDINKYLGTRLVLDRAPRSLVSYLTKLAMAHIASVARSRPAVKVAKPLLSVSNNEAKRRVINLYRSWWREVRKTVELKTLLL